MSRLAAGMMAESTRELKDNGNGRPTRRRRLVVAALLLVGLALAVLGAEVYAVYADGQRTSTASADAGIVLGATVRGDQPSAVFRERINHAIDLLHRGQVQWLILTGGQGQDTAAPEARIAADYARRSGVPSSRLLLETQSHNTYQNLYYARGVAGAKGLRSFLIVSDPYHMHRAMMIARDLHLPAEPSPTPTSRMNSFRFLVAEAWRSLEFRLRRVVDSRPDAGYLGQQQH